MDLKTQNKLVKDFEQEIGISIDAKYNVIIEVQTNTEIYGEQVANKYTSSLAIDVGKKTTTIKGENDKEDTQYVSKEIEHQIQLRKDGHLSDAEPLSLEKHKADADLMHEEICKKYVQLEEKMSSILNQSIQL